MPSQRRHLRPDYGDVEYVSTGGEVREIKTYSYLNYLLAIEKENFDETPSRNCKWAGCPDYRPLNCNSFHELGLNNENLSHRSNLLGEGVYRAAYSLNLHIGNLTETVVFKEFSEDLSDKYLEYVRMEAYVMSRLASSQYIVDMYAFCHLSVLVENFPRGDMKEKAAPFLKRKNITLYDTVDVNPLNKFTLTQKVKYALDMARGIEAMHSIDLIHDDLKLAQFLLGNNDHIKLNDFSRTKERVWDPLLKRVKVYRNSGRHGDCRSPEEYAEKELTEKIDIFSLGSIMFSLLTGLIPFDEITDEEEMMDKFMAGKLPFIDPRYKNRDSIERKFVEVMEDCWKFKPEDRPTAVEVARRLEELVMEESI